MAFLSGCVFSLKIIVMIEDVQQLKESIRQAIKSFPPSTSYNKARLFSYNHVLRMITDFEPKIFEIHGNFGACFVCAKSEAHALVVISKDWNLLLSELITSKTQEVPEQLYTECTMEREGEEGTEMVTFHQYMNEVRGAADYEVICDIGVV